ncbi:MAG: NADP-dependent malic enzyme [Pseudomonadota bacterium]|jgi:malate dehydrogenase (oxaloacetate-decarboxylating)(NADP+)|nr:NADP-dependent malic enzyme [Pseudomonadota bacterium]MEC9097677.1 NADP-dependent malic enzyme [Pseudomonadota bacterium]MED5253507.1 NADP-dependent malic enzyme [Pseudomonadota bacterium]|tara:strand:- start:4398 stop:6674 length:2277 start_codon:yes stop_codon:yes gene_type:complete
MSDKDKKSGESYDDKEALRFHAEGKPGKIAISATKPMETQSDLSLAYSPGVAAPVIAISEKPETVYDYTSKGNLVAVISNGSAILGLGNLGSLAAKPVMEGKAVLFKRFADVDAIDIEIDSEDAEIFSTTVEKIGRTFGGINLEDISAPDCFIIESELREKLDIPVFHDDQHGTAIISTAGIINALDLTNKKIEDVKVVVNGAGAAGIACLELLKSMGLPHENAILCDSKGPIYIGRDENINQWKAAHAIDTDARSLADAMRGSDIFLGLSVKDALTQEMLKTMNKDPIIFAMANPDPEIDPKLAREVRPDCIIATGRSDYPNQVNNVLGFPYIFRGALDVRAKTINDEMKIACAEALAKLAREDVPDEVAAAYSGIRPRYGPDYIIPAPFDPRLIRDIPPAVAKAAQESGVARMPIVDEDAYKNRLSARLDPAAEVMQPIYQKAKRLMKRVVFAEGEEEKVIRAALNFRELGLGIPVLVGRKEKIEKSLSEIGQQLHSGIEIVNAEISEKSDEYANYLYSRLQRRGVLTRDCLRMVNNDRNIFSACMVSLGDADAMVTGVTRNYSLALEDIRKVIDPAENKRMVGISVIISKEKTVLVGDTNVHDMPSAEEIADITQAGADLARKLGLDPHAALLAYSSFGYPEGERSTFMREAVDILDKRNVDFEYDGEMAADVALNPEAMKLYPFCRLTEPANVLIMPAIHSASISTKLLQELGGATLVGPLLVGLSKPVQIAPTGCTVSELVNLATIAACDMGN